MRHTEHTHKFSITHKHPHSCFIKNQQRRRVEYKNTKPLLHTHSAGPHTGLHHCYTKTPRHWYTPKAPKFTPGSTLCKPSHQASTLILQAHHSFQIRNQHSSVLPPAHHSFQIRNQNSSVVPPAHHSFQIRNKHFSVFPPAHHSFQIRNQQSSVLPPAHYSFQIRNRFSL